MLSLANWLSRSSTSGHSGYGFYVCGLTFHWTFVSLAVPLTLMCFTGWVWPVPLMLCCIGCDLFHWSFHVFFAVTCSNYVAVLRWLWPVPLKLSCYKYKLGGITSTFHNLSLNGCDLNPAEERDPESDHRELQSFLPKWLHGHFLVVSEDCREPQGLGGGGGGGGDLGTCTLWASLSCTFLQTLPDLVTPLKGHSLSPRSCPPTRSAPSERFRY